ncbi:MAG: hypothetical protein Q8L27_01790, partial [archaeon]|nr:hypothetical protein [archaeon]
MVWNVNKRLEEITLEDFHGYPRASSWIPRHEDVAKIVAYANLVTKPAMLDAGCGNGFIPKLFAKEGLEVTGIDEYMDLESLEMYAGIKNLQLRKGDAEDGKWYKHQNIVFNSWMPRGIDWSGCFKYAKPTPTMIIYVKSTSSGMQPGMSGNFNNIDTYALPFEFSEVARWPCFGNDAFLSDENFEFSGNKTCEVIIQSPKEFYEKNKNK